ncbi:hypothetical protein HK105_202648 [Polyrhizophydium stewartii]|uniref:ATPase inhibitor, mitochondrial n=1 Tax=Polyrhizophydium stewartii TaxID=2732419 RepID=A0ABR4NE44_9FUNG|nr:hypothetical protein HK105_000780 [Polyrhizophydium stewartii]
MFRITSTTRSAAAAVAAARTHVPTAAYSGSVRAAGGSFASRESAEEERYAHEQELAALRKLKAELAKREAALAQKLGEPAPPAQEQSEHHFSEASLGATTVDSSWGGAVRTGGGSLGKKEAAAEAQYIHDHEREKLEQLRKQQKH